MEAAETQLARALKALTTREFPFSRGLETRLDVYLQLEELLRLEDSEASVRELQRHVSSLLSELRLDLQLNSLSDVLHAALRCLSYLMHHRSLAAAFSEEHMTVVLGDLVPLLFSTQDQTTYKLCLWCLTVQNFPAERHKLLQRTVEGLVQAVVNPFKSRAIEVQALKGLHLLLVKYPEQLGVDGAVLSIYVRPIASRLGSSESSTRTQARLVLEETSKHLSKWTQETLKMVQHCAEKYMLPTMKMHMEHGHNKDAVLLWKLTLVLLQSKFTSDLGMLNKVLYVPEKCMEDEDAAVRLMAMQAWTELADIFHDTQNWLFNKAVVSLLVWPIKACLEQELLLNVVNAAFTSWHKIVTVAVQDFNAYCKAQQHAVEARQQQNVPEWKFWFGELVISPLLILVKKRIYAKDQTSTVELDQFIEFAKVLWELVVRETKSCTSRSENSSCTTIGGSSVDGSNGAKLPVRSQSIASKTGELSSINVQACNHVRITSELIGIAFMLEDIFRVVHSLIKVSDESRDEYGKSRANDLVMTIWRGFCQRIHPGKGDGTLQVTSNFGLRLVWMSMDFTLGLLTSWSGSAELTNVPADQGEQNAENQTAKIVVASVGFGLEWQLQLLAPLVSGLASPGYLQAVMLHPKSKLFDHISRRMEYLKGMYVQCATVLEKWSSSAPGEVQVDFSVKSNALSYLVMNLLFEYAVFVDDTNNDGGDRKQSTLELLDTVMKKLTESVGGSIQQQAQGLGAIIRFGEESIRAAHELVAYGLVTNGKRSMLDELVSVSKNLTEHTYESQQNASILLDLHQSRGEIVVVVPAMASTASCTTPSIGSDAEEKSVVQEPEYVSASLDTSTSSPCLLSGEIPSASPIELSPALSIDKNAKPPSIGLQNSDRTIAAAEETNTKAAPTTPEQIRTEQSDTSPSKVMIPSDGWQSAPPKLSARRSQRPNLKTLQCIYPDLVGCTEGIASLYRHFPMGFRPFFSFYKVKTIGDLSALPVEKVRTFGLKEPVSTVRRALEEFNGRKDRMKSLTGSPYRQKGGLTTTSPSIATPSPHKPPKRPFHLESGGIAPLALEKREHKRTKRSLVLDGEDGDEQEESEGTRRKPKLADRVTFCLQTGETGETRITRPGEDSQDQLKASEKVEEKESVQEKMDTYTLKLLQHLRRSVYYVDKLVSEEESLSEEASLEASIENVGGVITNYQEAHELVSRLASQLHIAAETSSRRCRKLMDKRVVMEFLASWSGLAIQRREIVLGEDKESLLAQTPHWNVRKGSCGGAHVVLYSCRSTPLKLELWTVSLEILHQFVAPYPHPNIVQFLGVVTPSEEVQNDSPPPNECIIMEYLPVSLYDALHRDRISLSRREIALIAIHILQGLLFLHQQGQSLGVCLTSKKVMLDGSNCVKLRRFGLEMVLRSGKAPSQLSKAALKTTYEMTPEIRSTANSLNGYSSVSLPGSFSPSRSSSQNSRCLPQLGTPGTGVSGELEFTTITQDLFAFGVLLLEMCAGEKPTNELFNRSSCAKQIDPMFYSVLQLTLSLGGAIAIERRLKKPMHVTTEALLDMIVANEQQRAVEEQRLSSSSFPCFLYADRYFVAREAEQVEINLRERDRRGEIELKRLAAVECELLEEQKNFAILVLQLEQAQKEMALKSAEKQQVQAQLHTLEQTKRESDEKIKHLVAKTQEQTEELLALQASFDEEHRKMEILQLARVSDAEEKQGLLFEILKLKEEKRKLVTEKQEIETECAAIARKVGGEKEALEDLEGRLTQAIHRWEEEQRLRRKAERQTEGTNRQLLQMEEEWCKYSSVLQQSPTGKRVPQASFTYVLALKDKEIEELAHQLQEAHTNQAVLQADIARRQAEWSEVNAEKETLRSQQVDDQNELLTLRAQIEDHERVITGLHKQLQGADNEIEVLKSRVIDFEEELVRQAKNKADEEKARKLRQCLTPHCDAPRYLVGASGYCKECEERTGRAGPSSSSRDTKQQRHRRHRSWDDASIGGIGIRKNVKNIPVMKLVRVLSGGSSEDARVEDADLQQLLQAVKQLTSLLKSDDYLKDDLPECLAIKSVLALMHQQKGSLVLQLECCKCLSVVVFNHDRNRLIVVAEGGVDPVLAAMKNFQSEAKMQETSCVLLTNLAHNCETNRKRILDAGGIDAVLQAMQTFPDNCGVQKRSCWALLTLAGSDLMCDSIAMRGGLGAIIAAMLNCPADEHVQFYGSWALVNLLSGTERLQAFARREGVREVAEAAHAYFPGHEGIQEKTLEILRLLG